VQDVKLQDAVTQTVELVETPAVDNTNGSKNPADPRPPNSFQLKQQNEAIIARFVKAGLFPNKQAVIQAALISLLGQLRQINQAAPEAKAVPNFPESDPAVVDLQETVET
jgi:Arc/MetJ-type ribon-helix-helix transcriptional regulator